MKIYDISMSIDENIIVYKNKEDKKPKIIVKSDFNSGSVYESNLSIDMHTGTHIDAPLHMIKDGKTISSYNLENFITKCKVFDLTSLNDKISVEDIKDLNIETNDFVIFKTKNSNTDDFDFNFVYVDKSAAFYLSKKQIIGVGIDSLGIERNQVDHETHITLLEKGIVILEGLRLKDIKEGTYTLVALPLKVNLEASLTRAVLIEN